jgi:GcrA cell cycle regulator
MAWTDERVATLKKLWADGLSASQIAKQLGGVTRNAVIGKVQRLNLPGRATPSRPNRKFKKPNAPKQSKGNGSSEQATPSSQSVALVSDPVALPDGELVTVLTIKDSMCKWPIGHPNNADFRFCGAKTHNGGQYCEGHASMAYQPRQKRRRKASDVQAALDSIAATRRSNF